VWVGVLDRFRDVQSTSICVRHLGYGIHLGSLCILLFCKIRSGLLSCVAEAISKEKSIATNEQKYWRILCMVTKTGITDAITDYAEEAIVCFF